MEGITNILDLANIGPTNIVDSAELQQVAEQLIGNYGWIALAALITLLSKDVLMNFVQGILIFYGHDFDNDDVIYISGRQARIVRVGVRSTTFYMTDRGTKMVVPNEQLKQLTVEKRLSKNGGEAYLPAGSDPAFIPTKTVEESLPIPEVLITNFPKPSSTSKRRTK